MEFGVNQEWIRIRNATLHSLKGVHLDIPVRKITAIAGPSGSGKSSLALGVLHAECRRRYLETLQLSKREVRIPVDSVEGLRPSIALGPLQDAQDIRHSVGSSTECDALLRPIWARLSQWRCPQCSAPLDILAPQQMVERIATLPSGSKVQLFATVPIADNTIHQLASQWIPQGFTKASSDGVLIDLSQIDSSIAKNTPKEFSLLIDRWVIKEGMRSRIADSLQTGLRIGKGAVWLQSPTTGDLRFADHPRCPQHGDLLPKLDAGLYSPFSPVGQCPQCHGLGHWNQPLEVCTLCEGTRLMPLLQESVVGELSWKSLQKIDLQSLLYILKNIIPIVPTIHARSIQLVLERLQVCLELGLGHLHLQDPLLHLADSERQRLRLVGMASGHLDGLLVVLDELGSGLDATSCECLWPILQRIVERGNTIVMVEHNPHFLKRVDYLVEMGPGAGELGGEILRQGFRETILSSEDSTTAQWLRDLENQSQTSWTIKTPEITKTPVTLEIPPIYRFSARSLPIVFPGITLLTGSGGSGKSVLLSAIEKACLLRNDMAVSAVGESSLGIAKRSSLATASGIMNSFRDLYASLPEAKIRGLKAGHFSTNTKGGRCESCQGLGVLEDPLGYDDFTCHVCQGLRFREEVLAIRFKSLHISNLLDTPIHKLLHVFDAFPLLRQKLSCLQRTGLDYLNLGISTSAMSNGELQRAGLALDLAKSKSLPTLYLLDTPSRGLHHYDLQHLTKLFVELVQQGHGLVIADPSKEFVDVADTIVNLDAPTNA